MLEPPLTSQGEERREAILRLMKQTASHRRRRRHVIRGVGVCAVLALSAALAIRLLLPRNGGAEVRPSSPVEIAKMPSAPVEPSPPAVSTPPTPPVLVIGMIETDPTILSRWSATPQHPSADTIQVITDDDDLIRTLAAAGQPAGIIEVDGQATVVTSSANQ